MIETSSSSLLISGQTIRTVTSLNSLFLFTVRASSLVLFQLFICISISGLIILLLFFVEPSTLALFSIFTSITETISPIFISLPFLSLRQQSFCFIHLLHLQVFLFSFSFLILRILFILSFQFELFTLYWIFEFSYFCLLFMATIIISIRWFFVVTQLSLFMEAI